MRNTPRVLGFLGSDTGPQRLGDEEVAGLIQQATALTTSPPVAHLLEVGQMVRVCG